MPNWTYDVIGDEETSKGQEKDLAPSTLACTLEEIDANLEIDDTLQRSTKRR